MRCFFNPLCKPLLAFLRRRSLLGPFRGGIHVLNISVIPEILFYKSEFNTTIAWAHDIESAKYQAFALEISLHFGLLRCLRVFPDSGKRVEKGREGAFAERLTVVAKAFVKSAVLVQVHWAAPELRRKGCHLFRDIFLEQHIHRDPEIFEALFVFPELNSLGAAQGSAGSPQHNDHSGICSPQSARFDNFGR